MVVAAVTDRSSAAVRLQAINYSLLIKRTKELPVSYAITSAIRSLVLFLSSSISLALHSSPY